MELKKSYSGFNDVSTYGFKRTLPVSIDGLNKTNGSFTFHVQSYDKYNNPIGPEYSKTIKVANKKFKQKDTYNGNAFKDYSLEIKTPGGTWGSFFSSEQEVVFEEGDSIEYRWNIPKYAKCELSSQILSDGSYFKMANSKRISGKTSGKGTIKAVYYQKNPIGGMSTNYLSLECPTNKKVIGLYTSLSYKVELEKGW